MTISVQLRTQIRRTRRPPYCSIARSLLRVAIPSLGACPTPPLDAARTAGFTAVEWEAYTLAGIAIQNERGALAVAEKRGRAEGLRQGVEVLCRALGIELTDQRRRELANMDAAKFAALLAQLDERNSWT